MRPLRTPTLIKFMVIATFASAIGQHWDGWWHVAMGRDAPYIPPHLTMAIFFWGVVIASIMLLVRRDFHARKPLKLYIAMKALVFLAGPLDELWHRRFGSEVLTSSMVLWSPTHLLIFIPNVVAALALLGILRELKGDPSQSVFVGIQTVGVWAGLNFVLLPTFVFGPWRVLGLWGIGLTMLAAAFSLLIVTRLYQKQGVGVLATLVFLILLGILLPDRVSPEIKIGELPRVPFWALALPFLLGAVVLDFLIPPTRNNILRGIGYAVLVAALIIVSAIYFAEGPIGFEWKSLLVTIPSAAAGGAVAGFFARRAHRLLTASE